MSSADTANTPVPPEEVERRLAEYRRLGFQRQAPAQVVYQGAAVVCPWEGCGLRIDGIHFRLEQMGDRALQARLLDAWWNGPGLVGTCPRCQRLVLFGLLNKQALSGPVPPGAGIMPGDWSQKAHLVTKPG